MAEQREKIEKIKEKLTVIENELREMRKILKKEPEKP